MSSSNHLVPIGDAVPTMLARTRRLWDEGSAFPGVATGLTDLDRLLGGLQPGTITVVGSVDRAASDAFANRLLLHVALYGSRPVLYGAWDFDPVYLAIRLASAAGRVPWSSTWSGRLTAPEWTRLEMAASKLGPVPLWVIDQPVLTMDVLEAAIDGMPRDPDEPGLVVVDRLSRVAAHTDGQFSGETLRRVRELAATRSLAVVAIEATDSAAQLRSDPRPKIADLPEPAVWVDHAEAIALVYDPSAIDPYSSGGGSVECNVAMNRHGPVGICEVAHLVEAGVLANMAPDEQGPITPLAPSWAQ